MEGVPVMKYHLSPEKTNIVLECSLVLLRLRTKLVPGDGTCVLIHRFITQPWLDPAVEVGWANHPALLLMEIPFVVGNISGGQGKTEVF